jgi:hypothetical protein
MIEPIFHDGKKSCVGDKKLNDWIKWFVAIHNVLWGNIHCFRHMSFSVNKKQKKL